MIPEAVQNIPIVSWIALSPRRTVLLKTMSAKVKRNHAANFCMQNADVRQRTLRFWI
jgi:hypothetical protein